MNATTIEEEIQPKWDIALEALLKEEIRLTARELRIDDFLRLAQEHAIRFDDILDTAFRLVIHGRWRYREEDGTERPITQDEVNKLYVGGRIRHEDVTHYTGSWSLNTTP